MSELVPASEARSLAALDNARREIALAKQAGDVDALREWRDQAAAVQHYTKARGGAKDVADDAGEVKVRAERALGQLDLEANPRGRPEKDTHSEAFSLDIAPNTRAAWRKLGEVPEDEFDVLVVEAREDDNAGVSTAHLVRLAARTTGQRMVASNENEWYTPERYIEAARRVLGDIDLDPATSELANETVRAATPFTADDDGLAKPWFGRLWLNPPYGRLAGDFITRLVAEYTAGAIDAAVALVNAHCTDTKWFQPLWDYPLCFTDHRIDFGSAGREKTSTSTHGSVFAYLGSNDREFAAVFSEFGPVVRRWAP